MATWLFTCLMSSVLSAACGQCSSLDGPFCSIINGLHRPAYLERLDAAARAANMLPGNMPHNHGIAAMVQALQQLAAAQQPSPGSAQAERMMIAARLAEVFRETQTKRALQPAAGENIEDEVPGDHWPDESIMASDSHTETTGKPMVGEITDTPEGEEVIVQVNSLSDLDTALRKAVLRMAQRRDAAGAGSSEEGAQGGDEAESLVRGLGGAEQSQSINVARRQRGKPSWWVEDLRPEASRRGEATNDFADRNNDDDEDNVDAPLAQQLERLSRKQISKANMARRRRMAGTNAPDPADRDDED